MSFNLSEVYEAVILWDFPSLFRDAEHSVYEILILKTKIKKSLAYIFFLTVVAFRNENLCLEVDTN